MIGKAIYSLLTAATAVTDIVGTRVSPLFRFDPSTMPYICYDVDETPDQLLHTTTAYSQYTVNVSMFALTYSDAQTLKAAVVAALNGQRGEYGGVCVSSITVSDSNEDTVASPQDPNKPIYMVDVAFTVVGG